MKSISVSSSIKVPEGVKVEFKSRQLRVTGPRGTLTKSLKSIDMEIVRKSAAEIVVTLWHANRKHSACLRTVCSHIMNLIKGVTNGFEYKMRLVYAHFPINVNVVEDGTVLEIRNFLGERVLRRVEMLDGVKVVLGTTTKDELILTGNSVENVSQSAASIRQSVLVKNKDIRKFLDGIYVSEKREMKVE
eukprot:Partr_v1_DN24316_c1_g1_i1_m31638 putative ribosomal protein l9